MTNAAHPVLVGVSSSTGTNVSETAARFAQRFGTGLVFVSVDPSRFPFTQNDGALVAVAFDSDSSDYMITEQFDGELKKKILDCVGGFDVAVEFRALAGEPARALSDLASDLDASMIVIGVHEGSPLGTALETLSGSIAAHLAHRQHRPVVVVPAQEGGVPA